MRTTLNLATKPFTDVGPLLRQLRIAMAVLVALSLLFGLGLHLLHGRAEEARKQTAQLDAQMARLTSERQGYQELMRQPANQRLVAETSALNDLVELKAFSWTLAVRNLETVLPAGVQVLTLEPQREKDGRISVHILVGGPREKVEELVRALEHSARFRNPYIKGETAEQSNSAGLQVRQEPVTANSRFNFDLMADYVPPTPEEMKSKGKAAAKPEGDAPATAENAAKHGAKSGRNAGGAR